MTEKRGKFIVLEGIDGSGKSSQIAAVANFILSKNKHNHLVITREPYKNREIRALLRKESNPYTRAEELARLYVEDRKEHVREMILPSLKNGLYVVSDRYKLATICYQSAQGLPIQGLIKMHEGLPVPDITIIVDVSVDVAEARMKKDSRDEHKFEANKQFQQKVRENYLQMPDVLPREKIFIVDGAKTIEEVGKEIISILEKIGFCE
jgi:dTMP kinase